MSEEISFLAKMLPISLKFQYFQISLTLKSSLKRLTKIKKNKRELGKNVYLSFLDLRYLKENRVILKNLNHY